MLDTIRHYIKLWKLSSHYKYDLDAILSQANPKALLLDRLVWFVDLMYWIRYTGSFHEYKEVENVSVPSARIRFLLVVLERNPDWKFKVSKTLRSIFNEVRAVELFAEAGLSEEQGVWAEFFNRVYTKVMPERPLSEGLSALFTALFPHSEDVVWVSSLDRELILKILEFYRFEDDNLKTETFYQDIEEALYILASQVRSMGLSASIRKRLVFGNIKELPFFDFTKDIEILMQSFFTSKNDEFEIQKEKFREKIFKCQSALNDVYLHLDKYGVNNSVVYILESSHAKLKRMMDLVFLLNLKSIDPEVLMYFISQMIEENQKRRSLRSLLSDNLRLISRKIVDRSAETGENYISQNQHEYFKLFKKALGGGAITSITVVLKFILSLLGVPLFFEGLFYALNYSVSFVTIQMLGFTLATKQPAMTGPTIASKLHHLDTGDSLDVVVDEIVKLIRSQIIGILGNICSVVPVAAMVSYLIFFLTGEHIIQSQDKMEYVFRSTHLLGPAMIYASFTGILLWASSVFAGYIDNWFFLNRMKSVISENLKLNFIFGSHRCLNAGLFLEKHISGLAANISLGFLLGLTPEVMSFLGLGLDVRHVTLSAGMFSLAAVGYGIEAFSLPNFWFALVGIFFIGLLNVGVSFSLAFWVAIQSRNIRSIQRGAIYRAVFKRLKEKPLSFILPPKKSAV